MGFVVDLPDRPLSPWLRLAHSGCYRHPDPAIAAGIRSHTDFMFLIVLSGSGWLAVEGADGRVPLATGSVLLMPPGVRYDWGRHDHVHISVHFDLHADPAEQAFANITYLPGRLADGWARRPPTWRLRQPDGRHLDIPYVKRPARPAAWTDRFGPLLRIYAQGGARSLADRLTAAAICTAAFRDWLELPAGGDEPADARSRVRRLVDELSAQPPGRDLAIPVLAGRVGLGPGAFRAAFAAVTGSSPRRWLERRRVEMVAEMLRDPRLPVAAVAAAAGYDDPFHFARVVRRVMGRPPSGLRG
jgi:AraC-like DNA-binding protein